MEETLTQNITKANILTVGLILVRKGTLKKKDVAVSFNHLDEGLYHLNFGLKLTLKMPKYWAGPPILALWSTLYLRC